MFIINTPKYKTPRDVVEGLLSDMKNGIAQSNSQRKHHKLERWHIKCIVQVLFRDTILKGSVKAQAQYFFTPEEWHTPFFPFSFKTWT